MARGCASSIDLLTTTKNIYRVSWKPSRNYSRPAWKRKPCTTEQINEWISTYLNFSTGGEIPLEGSFKEFEDLKALIDGLEEHTDPGDLMILVR